MSEFLRHKPFTAKNAEGAEKTIHILLRVLGVLGGERLYGKRTTPW